MAAQVKPLAEVTREAIRVLCRQMGVVNTVRFISQFTVGYGDYTEDRREVFGDLTLDDIACEIKRRRERGGKGRPTEPSSRSTRDQP